MKSPFQKLLTKLETVQKELRLHAERSIKAAVDAELESDILIDKANSLREEARVAGNMAGKIDGFINE